MDSLAGGFMSHGNCYLWKPPLIALHVISDGLIGLAYAAISLALLQMVRKARRDMPFQWIVLAFGGFIIACGCTHFMEIVTVWEPLYWLSGGIKALTAAASVATAIVLPRFAPEITRAIRSTRELEDRVRERTAELEAANEQLAEKAAIVSHSNDAIFSKTLEGIITSWNPGAERMYGYSGGEIIGKHVSILVPEDKLDELSDAMRHIRSGIRVDWMETERLRNDGVRIDAHLSISPICDAAGKVRGASVIARDVTDRKRTERQMRDTQKLESLGLIAGGIAHDFNNLLVGVMGNASLMLESLPASDPNRGLLEQVLSASEKAAHLTRQMLAYAGKGRFVEESIDLSALVREIGDLVRRSIPKSVALRMDLASDLPTAVGDPSQFQQLIMNLLINGSEAVEEGQPGTVTVVTRETDLAAETFPDGCKGAALEPGKYVLLEVRDDGCGMSEETISRIFDPFFTTKFTGRGLGLAATLGIVRGHAGAIRVESELGRGTLFSVLIPARGASKSSLISHEQQELRGSGTVLVVDDEMLVRQLAQATLERFGYTVLTAANGEKAVNLIRERGDEIDMVLLDLSMPVLGGAEAFRRIREIEPELRIVVSSGYDEAETVRKFTAEGIAAFIQKPYTAMGLARVVKRVVG